MTATAVGKAVVRLAPALALRPGRVGVEVEVSGGPEALALRLHRHCREVRAEDGAGRPVPLQRTESATVLHRPGDGPVRLSYWLPAGGRQAFVPGDGRLPVPVTGPYGAEAPRVSGPGGWVVGRGREGEHPLVVTWPPSDPPALVVEAAGGRVATEGRLASLVTREAQRVVRHLAERFGAPGEVVVLSTEVPGAWACSYPGVILFHPTLLALPGTLLLQFLPHEMAHQWFGNRLGFAGPGRLWLREALPEYLQLTYLRWRAGEATYARALARYRRPGEGELADELLRMEPDAESGLDFGRYHDLLAAGTRLWVRVEEVAGRAAVDRALCRLLRLRRPATVPDAVAALEEAAGRAVTPLVEAAMAGSRP